jgi:carboxypeptidase C (cathepsin A)
MDKLTEAANLWPMRLYSTFLLTAFTTLGLATAAPEENQKPDKPAAPEKKDDAPKEPVVRENTVEIAGKKIPYKVTTAKLVLKEDDGKARASIFHVSYERTDVTDKQKRPVMFAFNGGPGSSAVWLHLGVLGPKRVAIPGDGTTAPTPPARLLDNPESILDQCDLVFVDPVSTGYSRAEKDTDAAEFHGVEKDIASVSDFVRRWITEHDRWGSPKYILGESYGGIRVAGLAEQLQTRYGMNLNGVILLSSVVDLRTLSSSSGDDLEYAVYLPVFTSVAHFHGKLKGDRDAMIEEARKFAFGEYATALLQGTELAESRRSELAGKLASFSGIDASVWLTHDLRLDSSFFRAELLRKEHKVIGRFDARVAWGSSSDANTAAVYDPSYSLAFGAFSSAMMDYLSHDLGWKEEQPYEILTNKVQPWSWDASNKYVNLSDRLAGAMLDNPHLRVMVMCGRSDLATPPDGIAYSFRHLYELPAAQRSHITFTHYDGGHMFYLNPPDLTKCRADLVKFLENQQP